MTQARTFAPEASIKLNSYHSLLIINCNLPRCPERFIQLQVEEEDIIIETPGFSKHYKAVLKIPGNCRLLLDSERKEFNGNLLTVTWKVEFKVIPNAEQEASSESKEEYKAPLVRIPPVVRPKIVESKKHGRFEKKNEKVAILSNQVTEKCLNEEEVLGKIAEKAILKVNQKLHEKEEKMNKELEMFEEQQKARDARKAAKKAKSSKQGSDEKKGK